MWYGYRSSYKRFAEIYTRLPVNTTPFKVSMYVFPVVYIQYTTIKFP
jgi:hypothetical protein